MDIMGQRQRLVKTEFLRLSPLERIRFMNHVFMDFIRLKAKTKGVSEGEIYRGYLESRSRGRRQSLGQ